MEGQLTNQLVYSRSKFTSLKKKIPTGNPGFPSFHRFFLLLHPLSDLAVNVCCLTPF